MKIALATESLTTVRADVLALGVRAGEVSKHAAVRALDKATSGALLDFAKSEDFGGKSGEVLVFAGKGRHRAARIALVGLGKGRSAAQDARAIGVAAARVAQRYGALAVHLDDATGESIRAVVEGVATGAYRYTRYLTGDRKPKLKLKSASVLVSKDQATALKRAVRDGLAVAEAINFARDLVNGPPNDVSPRVLADAAKTVAEEAGLECTIWGKEEIEAAGMNLLLAVNRGSAEPPRFIHVAYKPENPTKRVAFVGKGLTFDSGGLCLKPAKSMLDMKCDMSGGATTIAIVRAAAALKLPVEVHAIVPSTENMTGGAAYRPGDVFTSHEGKTVEIINTDAEGRLILADALSYAAKLSPDYIVDHATLTGACMVALGPWRAGLFANDDELAQKYAKAGEDAGEDFWRMPLDEDLRDMLKSDIADLKHTGESYGGSITAALFLKEFVGKAKWAHLDIAGPAYLERPHGVAPKGGTGFGVLTAIRFLEQLGA